MEDVFDQIADRVQSVSGQPGFLDVVLGERKAEALEGAPVVLFGAGSLGKELLRALRNSGVSPIGFCDSDATKAGRIQHGLPVLSVQELYEIKQSCLVVIATETHARAVAEKLRDAGFPADRVCGREPTEELRIAFLHCMLPTQAMLEQVRETCPGQAALALLRGKRAEIAEAHDALADQKSKDLLVAKLAVLASHGHLALFRELILSFSEPMKRHGYAGHRSTSEDECYFENDLVRLADGEVYVDVGAFDGDTVLAFVAACQKQGKRIEEILALEPDPACFATLERNTAGLPFVACHRLGLWDRAAVLPFVSSARALHDQAAAIHPAGDVEIQVVSLDELLQGRRVTLIKMDPPGNIIPKILRGAAGTIARHRPQLALGAYHGLESIFEIPLLVRTLGDDYRLFLRHDSYHLCDTDLFAIPG